MRSRRPGPVWRGEPLPSGERPGRWPSLGRRSRGRPGHHDDGVGAVLVRQDVDHDDRDVVVAAPSLATATSSLAASLGSENRDRTAAIWSSETSRGRPSLHSRYRSPCLGARSMRSTSHVGSTPRARVRTWRWGWTAAWASLIRPSSTSSCTRLWSTVSCLQVPSVGA